MSDNRAVAGKLLGDAAQTILKDRPGVHGSAENSFAMIGEMWTTYLRHTRSVRRSDMIRPVDVAQMMSILKKCRAIYGDVNNADNFIDDIGYSALGGMLQLPDPEPVTAKPTPEQQAESIDISEEVATEASAVKTKHTNISA